MHMLRRALLTKSTLYSVITHIRFKPSNVLSAFQAQLREHKAYMDCRINLGTADELALDMLINALSNFSRE